MTTRAWQVLTTAVFLGTATGCRSDPALTNEFGPFAMLRVAQTAQNTASLRVRVGTSWSAQMLPGSLSGMFQIPVGTQSVLIETTGGSGTGSTRSMDFVDGQRYLLVALDSGGVVVPTVLADTGALPVAGKSKVRVIHSAALAPAIDVWRRQPDYDTLIRFQFPIPYRTVSPYFQSDPGDWHVTVSHENQQDTLYASPAIPVGDGKLVTVIVIDSSAAGGVSALVIADN